MFNILTEPLIQTRTGQDMRVMSLPEVYAKLMADNVDAFPALRPHQRHAWHAFLVQLGAMAMHRAEVNEPPRDPGQWAALLRGLTPDSPDDAPWHVVVDDLIKPAFMQPPARTVDRKREYKINVATPDQLDMLITAKNHDLKAAVAVRAGIDDWLFALITLQTMQGFSGGGSYGISRMNGGLASRPMLTMTPSSRVGAHVRRDIMAVLEYRPRLLAQFTMTEGGAGLLWILPWDGGAEEALAVDGLEPLYIEVCRRIRLSIDASGNLYGMRAASKATRVAGKELKGRTGDPWVPVNPRWKGLPLTPKIGCFTYRKITDYLTDWELPPLMRPTESENQAPQPMQLVARALVRGQGITAGYHERIIPVRHKAVQSLGKPAEALELGIIARERVTQVGVVQRILRRAIQVFAARGDLGKITTEHRSLAQPWVNKHDEIIDRTFFEALQTEFEAPGEREGIRKAWLMNGRDGVVDHARRLLHAAADTLPCLGVYRYRARANAGELFEGGLRADSGLPFLFSTRNREDQ